ncbi:MAG: thioredoxin [Chloroflexota bacterium]|nr:thioredoxin [Chloroflexota bacterium]
MAKTVDVTDDNFRQIVEKATNPILVDFWAPWCGPCQAVGPIIEELANEYEGKVDFAKVNVDENPKVASAFSVQSIPTLLIFKDGRPMTQLVGARPKADIKKNLDASLV